MLLIVFAALPLALIPAAAAAPAASEPEGNPLSLAKAVILGVVEGVTEYLPVSSTGHLLVVEHALGITADNEVATAADSYAIAIQFGAILAVVVLYWRRLLSIIRGLIGRDRDGRRLAVALLVSFIPAAVLGFLGEKVIKEYLFALWPITAAWLVGGVVILLVAAHDSRSRLTSTSGVRLEDLRPSRALVIGLLQCVAMWPGVSRSLVTILGGRLVGLSTVAAVEYSFLLGLVTLTAATAYEAVNEGATIIATFGIVTPLVGVLAAFVSAALAVKWMVSYLQRRTLAVFGWYRLLIGAAVAALILAGAL